MKLSKLISFFFFLLMSLCFICSCGKNKQESTEEPIYTVFFDSDGGSSVESMKVIKGDYIPKPSDPIKDGYYFIGWFCGEEEWSFIGYVVSSNITLKAKWGILGSEGLKIEGTKLISIGECDDKDIVIPSFITDVEDFAFKNCSELISFKTEKGSKLIRIGDYAFAGCSNLISIILPDGVRNIGDSAFRACSSLTDVVIPNTVTAIGSSAFSGCSNLASITIPFIGASLNGTGFAGSNLFGYIFGASYYSNNGYHIPTSLKKVIITGGTEIGNYAFYGCDNIKTIEIPNSVTSIGEDAFRYCKSLTCIKIPDSVSEIGVFAFFDCGSLTIYCEAAEKPSDWNSNWNYDNRPVYWAGQWHYDENGNPKPNS